MSFNLVDTIKSSFTQELISKTASQLGESDSAISKALSGAVPSVLLSLFNKSKDSNENHGILEMCKTAASSGILSNLGGFLPSLSSGNTSSISSFASSIFGDKFSSVSGLISNFAGIKSSSATSILNMAAPAALASIGNHAKENNLSAVGIGSLLSSQKDSILASLPSGFNLSSLSSMLGLGSIGAAVSNFAGNTGNTVKESVNASKKQVEEAASAGSKWLWALIPLFLIGGLIWYFTKDASNKSLVADVSSTVDTSTKKPETSSVTSIPTIKVTLPNGVVLDAYKGGIEDKLVSFLSTNYKELGADSLKKLWFDFDNLNFKTGSAELTTESTKQIENIVSILKAFPQVKIKIGGYTDRTGNEASNVQLSGFRANKVKTELVKANLGNQVSGVEGYGSKFAKYPSDAPESDRVQDRHVSISIRD
ncbi:MAG: DUF937 domain-containing protein [Chitinophagaceae bacterium]